MAESFFSGAWWAPLSTSRSYRSSMAFMTTASARAFHLSAVFFPIIVLFLKTRSMVARPAPMFLRESRLGAVDVLDDPITVSGSAGGRLQQQSLPPPSLSYRRDGIVSGEGISNSGCWSATRGYVLAVIAPFARENAPFRVRKSERDGRRARDDSIAALPRVVCARIQEAKLSLLGKTSMLESSSRRATSRWSGNSRLPAMFLRKISAAFSPPQASSSRQSMVGSRRLSAGWSG